MRILTWSIDQILQEVSNLENEVKNFKQELYKICWFMRGSISLREAYLMGSEDREIISNIVKENIETTKKSGLPFF
jgi:hypothetical protein